MGLCIDLAIAKTNKYASRESGDTAEVVERPGGGLSVVVADGQGSGRAAKSLSLSVTSKAVALLKEGARDEATARAVHDGLFLFRHGQVSATLDILSVDLRTERLTATRNGSTPLLLAQGGEWAEILPAQGPIGRYPATIPDEREFGLDHGLVAIIASDGVFDAGVRSGQPPFDVRALLQRSPTVRPAAEMADAIIEAAVGRDGGKPSDDMTVAVLRLLEHDDGLLIRRLSVRVPLP